MVDASEYRDRAAECQRFAEHAANDTDRAAWLKLAQSWLLLVRHADSGAANDDGEPPASPGGFSVET